MSQISVNCLSLKLNDKRKVHIFIVTVVIKILVQMDFNFRVMSCYYQGNSLLVSPRESYVLLYFYLKVFKQQNISLKQTYKEISTLL